MNTSTIIDMQGFQPGGAAIASQEILESLWKQFQELSNINSKALHTTTHKSSGSMKFEMKPKRVDAKFTLISSLCITNYLIERIRSALLMV